MHTSESEGPHRASEVVRTGERLLNGVLARNVAYVAGFVAVGAVMSGALSSSSDSILLASRRIGFVVATALLCAACLDTSSSQRSAGGALGLGALTGFALLPLNLMLLWLAILAGLGGGRLNGYPYGWMATATLVAALSIKFVASRLSPPLEPSELPRRSLPLAARIGATALAVAVLTSLSRSEEWPGDPLVEVHGRVVDQRGEPVGDVKVMVSTRNARDWVKADPENVRTAADGRFAFRAPREHARVEQLLHPRITRYFERLPRFDRDDHFLFFTEFDGYRRFVDRPIGPGSSPSEPKVFRVWRVDDFPEGVHQKQGFLHVDARESPSERYGVRFTCRFDTLDGVANLHRWRLTLQPIGKGGFQRAEDLFLSEAPADSYDVRSIVYGPPRHDTRWPAPWEGEDSEVWYYRSRDGETHGLFAVDSVDVRSGRREVCSIRFRYLKHIDDSSRNLAIKQSADGWDRY